MTTIQLRRGNAAAWTAANTTLAVGEPGYETDTGRFKIGDGLNPWGTLPYESDPGGSAATALAAAEAFAMAAVGTESTRAQTAEANLIPLGQRGAAGGVPTLDSGSKIPVGQLPVAAANGTAQSDRSKPVWSSSASPSPKFIYREPTYLAADFGVIADGAQHNNVANLLDCIAEAVANGIKRIELPGGSGAIVTTEAVANATVTADSGRTYTNNGGLPVPPAQPIVIEGHGMGITSLQLSAGFPRAFDCWWAADGQKYESVTLRRMTVDANSINGVAIAPLTAVTGGTTLTDGGTWTTLPGISATTFKNARLVYFPAGNSGTAQGIAMACRVSGSNVQVRNDSASTSYTLITGDQVQGAARDHILFGNLQFGGTVSHTNMSWDKILLEEINVINAPTMTAASLATAKADGRASIFTWMYINSGNIPGSPLTTTNFRVEKVYMNGAEIGAQLAGDAGTWIDDWWFTDSMHDTGVNPPSNYTSGNFIVGINAWVGRGGITRCHGKRSGDVAYEIDQPWEAHLTDNTWEDAFSGAYSTSFVPPARTSAGPATTTLNNGGTLSSGATSCTITALPAGVSRAGLMLVDTELLWYTANPAGTGLAIFRGINGSTAATHATNAVVTFIETFKTRIYDVRTRFVNSVVFSASASAGRGYLQFANANLPLPPLTIRDPTIDAVGGDLLDGQWVYFQGWQPDLDIQGMRLNQHGLAHSATNSALGSAISWSAVGMFTAGNAPTPIPIPRIYGRNNHACVHGAIGTSNNYSLLRSNQGFALLDFDIEGDIAMAGASAGSGVALAQLTASSNKMILAPGSRIGVKFRQPAGLSSDAAPTLLNVASSAILTVQNELDVDIDAYEMTYSGSTGDGNYKIWSVDATQVGKVRFGRIIHSATATVKYPVRKKTVVRVTTSASPYTCTGLEDEIHVDTNLGAVTINLPGSTGGASTTEYYGRGRELLIVDTGFDAATNNITITPVSTDKMDNGTAGATQTISTNGGHKRYTPSPYTPGWVTVG